jgi:hypothetical protein
MTRFARLLCELHDKRQVDEYRDDFPQVLGRAEDQSKDIPTLKRNTYRPASSMLKARFDFAGLWVNAQLGFHWLGLKEMRSIWRDREIRNRIDITRNYWDGSAPMRYSPDRLSLFALDPDDAGEWYLVWPEVDGPEPRLWGFSSQHESEYAHLEEYVVFLLS